MKKFLKVIIPILFISILAYFGYQTFAKINHKKQVAEHIKTIPSFMYETLEGKPFTQENIATNTPVLFVYFNSECDFCQHEAQLIKDNIEKLNNFQILFISFEPKENIQKFAEQYQLLSYANLTFIHDRKATFTTTFDVNSLPCLVLYNAQHQLIEKIKGQVKIEKILALSKQ